MNTSKTNFNKIILITLILFSNSSQASLWCKMQDFFGLSPQKKAQKRLQFLIDEYESLYTDKKSRFDFSKSNSRKNNELQEYLNAVRHSNEELNINREHIIKSFGQKAFDEGDILFNNLIHKIIEHTELSVRERELVSEITLRELLELRHSYRMTEALLDELKIMKLESEMLQAKILLTQKKVELSKLKSEPATTETNLLVYLLREYENLKSKTDELYYKHLLREQESIKNKRARLDKIKTAYPDSEKDLIYPPHQYVYDKKGQRRTLQDIRDEDARLAKEAQEYAQKLNRELDTSAFLDE